MATAYPVNYQGDPFNSDAITEYVHVQSNEYGGIYDDLVASSTANYPYNTPARYFLEMPFIPYTGDYVTYPMLIKDVTGGVVLTRVSGAPAANQYRVAASDSRRPHIIELHSGQASHTIGYDYYAIGSVKNADHFQTPTFDDVVIEDDVNVGGDSAVTGTQTVSGILYASSLVRLSNGLYLQPTLEGLAESINKCTIGLGRNVLTDEEAMIAISRNIGNNAGTAQCNFQTRYGSVTGAPWTATQDITGASLSSYAQLIVVVANDFSPGGGDDSFMSFDLVCWHVSGAGTASIIGTAANLITRPTSGALISVAYAATSNKLRLTLTGSSSYQYNILYINSIVGNN